MCAFPVLCYPFLCHLPAWHHVPHIKYVNAWAHRHYQQRESSPPFPTQRSRSPISGRCQSDPLLRPGSQLLPRHPQLSWHSLRCDRRVVVGICPSKLCMVPCKETCAVRGCSAPPAMVGLVVAWMSVCSTETGCSSLCLA